MVVEREVNGTNKTTRRSERRGLFKSSKKILTGPTLLEMSGYPVYQDVPQFVVAITESAAILLRFVHNESIASIS